MKDWKTFQQWSDAGYQIKKGSKATWFDGVAKFSHDQVVRHEPHLKRKWSNADGPWDDMDDWGGGPDDYGDN